MVHYSKRTPRPAPARTRPLSGITLPMQCTAWQPLPTQPTKMRPRGGFRVLGLGFGLRAAYGLQCHAHKFIAYTHPVPTHFTEALFYPSFASIYTYTYTVPIPIAISVSTSTLYLYLYLYPYLFAPLSLSLCRSLSCLSV